MISESNFSDITQKTIFCPTAIPAYRLKAMILILGLFIALLGLRSQLTIPRDQIILLFTHWFLVTLALVITVGRLLQNAMLHFRQLRFCLEFPILLSITLIYLYIFYLYCYVPDVAPSYSVALLAHLIILQFTYSAADAQFVDDTPPTAFFGQFLPRYSTVIKNNKKIQHLTKNLKIDDKILVLPTERIAADGIVISGSTTVNERIFRDPLLPRTKIPGDTVLAGTVNRERPIIIKVTKTFPNHTLAQHFKLILEKYQIKKQSLSQYTGIVPWFELFLLITAAVTLCWWLPSNPTQAFDNTIMMLLLSCPSSIGLAKTTILYFAKKACCLNGISIKNSRSLINLAKINHLLIDPTGVLTCGKLSVADFQLTQKDTVQTEIWENLHALNQNYDHPIAKAICQQAQKMGVSPHSNPPIDLFRIYPGKGLRGIINGQFILAGVARWLRKHGVFIPINDIERLECDFANNLVIYHLHCSIGGFEVARFTMIDKLKPHIKKYLSELQTYNLGLLLLAGQSPNKTAILAKSLGIRAQGKKTKAQYAEVLSLQNQGDIVAVAGAGDHLTSALACADVAISFSEDLSFATSVSDIIIKEPELHWLSFCIKISRSTLKKLKRSIVLTNAYYCVLLPFAMLGQATPIFTILSIFVGAGLVLGNSYLWYHKILKLNKDHALEIDKNESLPLEVVPLTH